MTDYEVWMEIAEHMRGSGVLPTNRAEDYCAGLCAVLHAAWLADVIELEQAGRMAVQLRDAFFTITPSGYFWPKGDVAPRIAACEFLARQCLEQS